MQHHSSRFIGVFHYSLPKYLSDKMERVQKRVLRILYYPSMHYNEALIESRLETLCARRYTACVKLFNVILDDPNHRLNELVPRSSSHLNYNLRKVFYRSFWKLFFVSSCLNDQN